MRLFFAVDIPDDIRERAGRLIDEIDIPSSKVRWVKPGNLHVTLKFLGETPKDRLKELIHSARAAAAMGAMANISVTGTGVFPNKINPRIFWLGIKGEVDKLSAWVMALETALAPSGYAKEDRPFTAHLTIGRVRADNVKGQVIRAATAHKDLSLGSFTCDRFVLYESQLMPGGSIYNVVETFKVGEPAR